MPLESAQSFLALEGRVHEIAVVLFDHELSREKAVLLNELIDNAEVSAAPWQVVERQFYQAMQADLKGNWISLGIIMLIVAIGVLNTVLMATLERTREFGVLRALGTRPAYVFGLILVEMTFLAVISVFFGGLAAWVGNQVLATYGIVLPTPFEYGGYVFDRLLGSLAAHVFWVPAAVTVGAAALVSMYPALRAARVVPVAAMRST